VAGGEAAEASVLAAANVVVDDRVPAVADLQMLDGAAAGVRGVGEEHLVAHAFVLVEEGELGAGVRAFTTHDDAGAVR
jgi:hypothetical protein